MNNFKIEIYKNKQWVDYSSYCVFPLKIADFLDEQLDEVELFIKRIKDEYFNPLTLVRVSLINSPDCLLSAVDVANIKARAQDKSIVYEYNEDTKRLTEKKERFFVVATDNAVNIPVGSEFYEHTIYLIESTKILEGFIGDSIAFTNTLIDQVGKPKLYFDTPNGPVASMLFYGVERSGELGIAGVYDFAADLARNGAPPIFSNGINFGKEIKIKSVDGTEIFSASVTPENGWTRRIKKHGVVTAETNIQNPTYDNTDIGRQTIDIQSGEYEILYSYPTGAGQGTDFIANFYVVENRYPLEKWTITEVINRTFDLIEPLDYGQKPRFRLSGVVYDEEGNAKSVKEGSLAEKLKKILAPEFSFTKMTLREQLQQIGGFIHGEPRIVDIHFDEDRPWFEVSFDKYGSNEKSNIKGLKKPITATCGTDINNYATNLDSFADNLINQIDYANGVMVEPFFNGERSLRTETVSVRLGENDGTSIATTYPIYQLHKVIATYIPYFINNNIAYSNVDITPYIFEKANYDNKSSFKGLYPTSKEYALYYTQGQKNIKGLFFKAPDALNTEVFSEHSIVNILRMATGNKNFDIYSPWFPEISFRVEYTPVYGTRIQTPKQTVIGGLPRSLAYNQSANMIESRYYGENLKGAIARMGNVEKQLTYNLAFVSDIPKVGTKFDEHYYISTISTEYLPSYIKCTLALSKDFNRLSEYVGISSNKRMWEVSEKQSQARDSIHNEYLLITEDNKVTNDSGWFMNITAKQMFFDKSFKLVSAMNVTTYSKLKRELARVTLPVISSSFGNSLSFTSSFEDNYSAGQKASYTETSVRGFWGQNVPYNDYYGRFYYLYYALYGGELNQGTTNRFNLPSGHVSGGFNAGATVSIGKKYRKDSREIPQITFQLSVVTDNDDIIIGSALTRNSALVNRSPSDIELYVFNEELNKINSRVDFENAIKVEANENAIGDFIINDNNIVLPSVFETHIAWALVTKRTESTITVEDEDGETSKQTIYKGGELIIGQNLPIENGKTLYFKKKKYVYD